MRIHLLLALGFILAAASIADAAPSTIGFTGRLATSTGPVEGTVAITFALYSAGTGGDEVWSETRDVTASAGLVYLDLGATTPLDATVFAGDRLYLQITIGNEVMSPRLSIQSTPYAIRSQVADTAIVAQKLGGIAPSGVVTGITASEGVTATRNGNGVALGLKLCAANQVLKSNGSSYVCAADNDTTYAPGAGLALDGSTFTLAPCAVGNILKSTGSSYACAPDANNVYAAGAGLALSGSTFSLASCPSGNVLKSNGSSYGCASDANSAYTAAAPLAMQGTTVTLNPCLAGEIMKWTGSSWQCAAPPLANCIVVSNQGGGTTIASCPSGRVAISGGCEGYQSGQYPILASRPYSQSSNLSNAWYCSSGSSGAPTTAYATCCTAN